MIDHKEALQVRGLTVRLSAASTLGHVLRLTDEAPVSWLSVGLEMRNEAEFSAVECRKGELSVAW